jgi:L-rhamnose mutarotase
MNSRSRVQRFHAVTGLRSDKVDHYCQLHASVWPAVLKAIRRWHIRNYSIAVTQLEGKFYLFSYFEYIGTDYGADTKKIAAYAVVLRWWQETMPCQLPLPDAAPGEIWSPAREVFHTR